MTVPHASSSASLVRHCLSDDLASQLPAAVVDDAALVVSELVGNAVRHGSALPGGGLYASWEVVGPALHLQVVDGGVGPAGRAVAPASSEAECGRGLALVEALTLRWGSRPGRPGTAVWAELAAFRRPA